MTPAPTDPRAAQVLKARLDAEIARRAWLDASRPGSKALRDLLLDEQQKQILADMEAKWAPRPVPPGVVLTEVERLKYMPQNDYFLLCHRGFGKSFAFVVYCVEQALQRPNSRIHYVAPLKKDAADIVNDTMNLFVLKDCPVEMKPKFDHEDRAYEFKNGSLVRFKGVNNEKADDLRGPGSHLFVLDECAQMDRLKYIIESIAGPMTERWGGKVLMATTPPETPAHDSLGVYEDCAGRGVAVKQTLLTSKRKTWEQKARILKNCKELDEHIPLILAGKMRPKKTVTMREYWCEFVTDAAKAVVPEMLEAEERIVVPEYQRPRYFDAYVAMDPGVLDRTAILFGYWDFERGVLVIEADALLPRAGTVDIADAIHATEHRLWGKPGERVGSHRGDQPYRRVSDVDLRLIMDLREQHGIAFQQARKDDSLAAVNLMRSMVGQGQIEIHASCTHLIRQLKTAIWNNKATDFARDEDGHADLLAALKYLCRSLDRTRNPFPAGYREARQTWVEREERRDGIGAALTPPGRFGERVAEACKGLPGWLKRRR